MHLKCIVCFEMILNATVLCLDKTAPNVCIMSLPDEKGVVVYKIECCPDFYEEEEKCKPCKAGTWGKSCSEACLPGTYGVECAKNCDCKSHEFCDPVSGCLCNDFTGKHCDYNCPDGKYGQNCGLVCPCLRGVRCDSVTGNCVCPTGFKGPSCSTCVDGFYGSNCSDVCSCNRGFNCHPVTGTCECKNDKECENGTSPEIAHHNSNGNFTVVIISSLAGTSVLITLSIVVMMYRRQNRAILEQSSQSATAMPANHYDEINVDDEMQLGEVVGNEVAPPLPNVICIPCQITVQNLDVEQNGTEQLLTRSLPNVKDDGTYLNPYSSPQPYYYEFKPYCVLSKTYQSKGSCYLHPYVPLKQPSVEHQSRRMNQWKRKTY